MNTLQDVFNLIDASVTQNGTQAITGDVLNAVLRAMAQFSEKIAQGDWQDSVKLITATPPANPSVSDRYLIGNIAPSGAWAGKLGQIAEWDGAAWQFTLGVNNMYVRLDSNKSAYYYNGAYQSNTWKWVLDAAASGMQLKAESWTADGVLIGDPDGTIISQDYLTGQPLPGAIMVFVNGVQYMVGDGVKTADCYFSSDDGVTANKMYGDTTLVELGDYLYWNPSVSGIGITAGWRINIVYLAAII